MPMFSAFFAVLSDATTAARVKVLREHCWDVCFEGDEDRLELVAALARLLFARWHSE